MLVLAGQSSCVRYVEIDHSDGATSDAAASDAPSRADATTSTKDGAVDADGGATTDAIGGAICGNGKLEQGELCDTAIASGSGACPKSCNDGKACTSDRLLDATTCRARCSYPPITTARSGDKCCPSGTLWYQDSDCPCSAGCWSSWQLVPGSASSGVGPEAVSFAQVLYLLSTRTGSLNNQIHVCSYSGSSWSKWAPVGMGRTVSPMATALFGGKLVVAARGMDDLIYVAATATGSSLGGGRTSWTPIGDVASGQKTKRSPSLAASSSALYVFVLGSGQLRYNLTTGTNFSTRWKTVSATGLPSLQLGPAAAPIGTTQIQIAVFGSSALQLLRGNPASNSWTRSQGATLAAASELDVVASGGSIHGAFAASTGAIYYGRKEGTKATVWRVVAGKTSRSRPAIVLHAGRLYLFVRGPNGSLWYSTATP